MADIDLLDGQQALFQVNHRRSTIPRCGDCGRFLRAGTPCMNPRCYGEGAYSHIPANAIMAAALMIPGDGAEATANASEALAAAWPHIIATINPPRGQS
jgi:hypothetical protein